MGGRLVCMPSPLDNDPNLAGMKGWVRKNLDNWNMDAADIDDDEYFQLTTSQVKKFYSLWERYTHPGPVEVHVQGAPMEYLYACDRDLNEKQSDGYAHILMGWNPEADLPASIDERKAIPKEKYMRSKFVRYFMASFPDMDQMFPNGAAQPVTSGLKHPFTLVVKHGNEERGEGMPLRMLRMPISALASLDPEILAAYRRFWSYLWKTEWCEPRRSLGADRELNWAEYVDKSPNAQREAQRDIEQEVMAQFRRTPECSEIPPPRAVLMEQWQVEVDLHRRPVKRRCRAYFAVPTPAQFDGGAKWSTLFEAQVTQSHNGEQFAGFRIDVYPRTRTETHVISVASLPRAQ